MTMIAQETDTPRLLYDPYQVAQALGVSRSQVYAEIARGRLASLLIGRKRRIPATEVARFIEARLRDSDGVYGAA